VWLAIFGYTAGVVLLFFAVLTYFLCIRFLKFEKPGDGISSAGGHDFMCDTADGCRIRGEVLIPRKPSGTAAILSDVPHGTELARMLLAEGIAVIRYQGRGYPDSGRPGTWGIREARDLRLIYTTIANREPDVCRNIGTIGRETGAAAALLHACMDDRVRFVAAISPYADLRDLTKQHLRDKGFPAFPLLQMCRMICRMTAGADIAKASPVSEIRTRGGLMKVPVLLISEQNNAKIPAAEVRKTAEALKGPVRVETLTAPYDGLAARSRETSDFRDWLLETIGQSASL
jgi:hypothetical protein